MFRFGVASSKFNLKQNSHSRRLFADHGHEGTLSIFLRCLRDKAGLFYKIKPKLKCLSVKEKNAIPILPGMAVTAEIKTGQRRVIEFFLSPLIKHVDESLTFW
jgi:hypothetical protein